MFNIADTKRNFLVDNSPTFYLADTCWSAFTNSTEEDWDYYLNTRKAQGFNVIQVNMLWQWDASVSDLNFMPFERNTEGHFDFTKPNDAYFERAERMISKANEKGLTIALVLLWCNYLPNTWASDTKMRQVGLFPKELVPDYVSHVVNRYDKYQPIYIVSGDTDFQTDEVIEEYYNIALNKVKELAPNALTTLHIRGRDNDLPEKLKENPNLDFYMYQSGHNQEEQACAYTLAEDFFKLEPKRPVINSEPCYEMMGYSRRAYGRFSQEDVRKAAWQSVLSGACAGLTYGAHGIWSWHNEQLPYDSSVGEAFETPYDWHEALLFDGAWDYAFIKDFIEDKKLFDLVPHQELIENGAKSMREMEQKYMKNKVIKPDPAKEIRLAENKNFVIVYVPSNIKLRLAGDFSRQKMTYLDLEKYRKSVVSGEFIARKNQTIIDMHHFKRDAVLIIEK